MLRGEEISIAPRGPHEYFLLIYSSSHPYQNSGRVKLQPIIPHCSNLLNYCPAHSLKTLSDLKKKFPHCTYFNLLKINSVSSKYFNWCMVHVRLPDISVSLKGFNCSLYSNQPNIPTTIQSSPSPINLLTLLASQTRKTSLALITNPCSSLEPSGGLEVDWRQVGTAGDVWRSSTLTKVDNHIKCPIDNVYRMINVVCYDEALSWSIIKFLVTWTRSRKNELPNISFKFSVYFSQFIYWTSLRPDEWENCDVTSATVKNLWEKIIWQLVWTNLVWSMLNALDHHDCYLFCGVQKVVSGNDWNQSINQYIANL